MLLDILKETFKKSFWTLFTSTIGGGITFFTAAKAFNVSAKNSVIIGVSFFFVVFLGRFIFCWGKISEQKKNSELLSQELETLKKQFEHNYNIQYDVMTLLNQAFSGIHWLRVQDDKNVSAFIEIMEFMCNKIKELFDKKTQHKCAVSLKIPMKLEGDVSSETRIINICRDKSSVGRNNDSYRQKNHTISNNTCFNTIFNEMADSGDTYYLNNDIASSSDYKNSSKGIHIGSELPYKSELVVAVTTSYEHEDRPPLLGFLCVDCDQIGVFDKSVDPIMLQGVAEGIFDLVNEYQQKIDAKQFVLPAFENKQTKFKIKDRSTKLIRK